LWRQCKSSLDRVLVDITRMRIEVPLIANLVFRESLMPHGKTHTALLSDLVRRPTFYQLNGSLQRKRTGRCENYVQMVRHEHVTVHEKIPSVAITEELFFGNRRNFRVSE
jgi:hypothetical protein